jgi:hypothetical protein
VEVRSAKTEVCGGKQYNLISINELYPDVDGRIILRGIFRKWKGVVGTGWSGRRIGTGGGHL